MYVLAAIFVTLVALVILLPIFYGNVQKIKLHKSVRKSIFEMVLFGVKAGVLLLTFTTIDSTYRHHDKIKKHTEDTVETIVYGRELMEKTKVQDIKRIESFQNLLPFVFTQAETTTNTDTQ